MLSGIVRLAANRPHPPSSSETPRTKAPSLPRSYPASSVLRASPPPHVTRPVPRGEPVEEFDLITGVSRVTRLPFANVPPSLPRWTASRCVCRLLPGRSTAFSQPGRDRRPRFAFRGLNEDSSVLRPACSLIPPKARLLAELRQLRCLRHRPRCFQVEPTITCYAMSPPLEVMGITRLSRRTRTPASRRKS